MDRTEPLGVAPDLNCRVKAVPLGVTAVVESTIGQVAAESVAGRTSIAASVPLSIATPVLATHCTSAPILISGDVATGFPLLTISVTTVIVSSPTIFAAVTTTAFVAAIAAVSGFQVAFYLVDPTTWVANESY